MKIADLLPLLCLAAVLAAGCGPERKYSTTEGTVTFACDESLEPVVREIAEDFGRSYAQARIVLRTLQGREAVADFSVDSVRRIVLGRALNAEERKAFSGPDIDLTEYRVALDAVAVIGHPDNPLTELRMGMLDSIFSGTITRWPWKGGKGIVLAVGEINSSTNEVFRSLALGGRDFGGDVRRFATSRELVDFVRSAPHAIGISGLAWLRGYDRDLRVFALGRPGFSPDSTQPPGRFYTPVQAHVHRGYYPLTRPVFVYSREVIRDVGYGFISYITSASGQKLFLNNGLVPATMPVRLVEITSKEVR